MNYRSLREGALAAITLGSLLFLLHPELFSGNSKRFIGAIRGDPVIYISIVEQFYQTSLWSLPQLGIFYPAQDALFYSDLYLIPGFIGGVIARLTGSLELGYNLPIVFAFLLNGLSVFALCRTFGVYSVTGALVSACAFMLAPFFREHLSHPQLQFFFFVPLALLAAERFARTPGTLNAIIFWLIFTASFLTGVYFGYFCLIFGGLWILCRAPKEVRTVKHLLIGALPAGAVLMPVGRKYLEVRDRFGERSLEEIRLFSADLWSFLSAPPVHNFWGVRTADWSHGGGHLFPGASVLFLGLLGIVVSRRYRPVLAIVGVVALLLSFGPGNPIFSLFFTAVPGFGALRAVSRFGLVVVLVLALFAGIAVSKCRVWVSALVIAVIAFELQMSRIPKAKEGLVPPAYLEAAALYREAVLGLPLGEPWREPTQFAVIQTAFWRTMRRASAEYPQPLVNGYSGLIPAEVTELARATENFPDSQSLSAIPVRHVLYSSRWKRGFDRRGFKEQLQELKIEVLSRDEYGNYFLRLP